MKLIRKLTTFAVVFMTMTIATAPAQVQLDQVSGIPLGKWSLAVRPYIGNGWDSIPVDVTSVTTEARKGLTADKVLLRNLSSRRVTGLKLQWYLKEKQQNALLLRDETPFINVDIPAAGDLRLEYPVVTFAKIYKPLLRGGELAGNYVLEIAVGNIVYEDGSSWEINEVLKGGIPTWSAVGGSGCHQ